MIEKLKEIILGIVAFNCEVICPSKFNLPQENECEPSDTQCGLCWQAALEALEKEGEK